EQMRSAAALVDLDGLAQAALSFACLANPQEPRSQRHQELRILRFHGQRAAYVLDAVLVVADGESSAPALLESRGVGLAKGQEATHRADDLLVLTGRGLRVSERVIADRLLRNRIVESLGDFESSLCSTIVDEEVDVAPIGFAVFGIQRQCPAIGVIGCLQVAIGLRIDCAARSEERRVGKECRCGGWEAEWRENRERR